MKTTQYVKLEKEIASGVADDIRRRWLWGLRLLRDPEKMSESGKSLKHGVTDTLISAAAQKADLPLSEREIRYRLQCARTYPTDHQIGSAAADFRTWRDLCDAGFPSYEAPEGEPPADHRTKPERDRERARDLMDLVGDQGVLFPLSDFEPLETTVKELVDYAQQQDEITARFAERGRQRRAYLQRLIDAADGDLSMTWAEACERLGEDPTSLTRPAEPI